MPLLIAAAFIGDNVNYFVGDYLGPRVFREDFRFLKRKYLEQTQAFYARHGGKTIIMARFVPIVRTFAPFVAGVGTMTYRFFVTYSIAGAALWVISLSMAGFFLGNRKCNLFTETAPIVLDWGGFFVLFWWTFPFSLYLSCGSLGLWAALWVIPFRRRISRRNFTR
jgi:membrane protein DedA with SNARE-associated domain